MHEIPQSATGVSLVVGPIVDFEDGVTPETGLDISSASSAVIVKYGGSSSINVASATWTEMASGWYTLALTSTMADTLGSAQLRIQRASVHVPYFDTLNVVHDNFYNYKYGSTAPDVGTVTGGVTGDITGSVSAITNVQDVGTVTGGVAGDITGSVSALSNPSDVGTVTGGVAGDITGSVSAITNASDVGTVTGNIANVQDVGTVTGGVAGDVTGSVSGVAANVWNAARTSYATAGSFGQLVASGPPKNAIFSDLMFLMVDNTDHLTPKTGLTVTAYVSVDGAAFAAASGSVSEISNGIYLMDATAGDMNGSRLTFRFTATDADDTFVTLITTI